MTRTRKPRRKTTTELGRSLMQKQRQRLAKEQAELAEKIAEDAARSRRAAKSRTRRQHKSAEHAVYRGIIKRIAGVLASEGVNVPITAKVLGDEYNINAWTDFSSIFLGYHLHDDVRLTAAVLRGMAYHEGGHCRFTVPFIELEKLAMESLGFTNVMDMRNSLGVDSTGELHKAWNCLEDQRMETAVVSDSPRKAGYFVPMVLSELAETPDKAAANWPLMSWRRYLPQRIRNGAKDAFLALHGAEGPALVRRVNRITTTYVLANDAGTMYTAVAEMAKVLRDITLAYDLTDGATGHQHQGNNRSQKQPQPPMDIPIDPSMGEDEDEEDENEDDEQQPQGGASKQGKSEDKDDKPSKGAGKADENEDDESDAQGGGADDEDDDESEADDLDGEGDEGDGDEADDEAEAETPKRKRGEPMPEGGAEGTHETDDAGYEADDEDEEQEALTQEELDQMLRDAEDERLADSALDEDVRAFQDSKADAGSGLDPYVGGVETDPGYVAAANNLAEDMKRTFETSTANIAPTWHEQQRRGVINVNRYVTRRAGDVEFFRQYVDEGAPGHDIAVSVLLDYSGSMGGVTKELATVAYGCKRACDMLDIPCTVVLWDTDARVLWDASERAEHVPVIREAGGTNPAVALDDLDAQTFGKSKHIVLIMTDDAWNQGAPTLAAYKSENRVIIGLGYTEGYYNEYIQQSMERKGADAAYSIKNLADIPKHLEQTLSAYA